MSVMTVPFVADTVARLLGILSDLAPKDPRRFPEIPGDTYSVAVPTRHGEIKCTIYRPPELSSERTPVYVNAHGGGFVIRYPNQDDPLCRYLAARACVTVINVNYTTAPRVRFPIPIEEVYDVLQWASSEEREWDGDRLCAGGQSAGGALVAAAARLALESGGPKIALQVLHYAALDLVSRSDRRVESTDKLVVPRWMSDAFITSYTPDPSQRRDRLASPAFGSNGDNIQGIAPALVITAEKDPLRDAGAVYADKLAAAGSLVEYRDVPGVNHGYDILNESDAATRETYDFIVREVKRATGMS